MEKIGVLFQGQGSQFVGMGKDLYEKNETFKNAIDTMDKISNIDIKRIMFEGNEEINNTKNTQVIMYAFEVAVLETLKETLKNKDVSAAGFSLGEYPALIFGEILNKEEGIKLVEKRANLMNNAMPEGTCMMAAVLGKTKEEINEELLNVTEGYVEIANLNCPGQIVISGEKDAVLSAIEKLKVNKNAKSIPLKVSGAFHTKLLDEASNKLYQYIDEEKLEFNTNKLKSNMKVYSNYTSNPYEADENKIKETLKLQMARPVRWEETITNMINDGVTTFVEIGAKKTLISFNEKIINKLNEEGKLTNIDENTNIKNYLISDENSLNEFINEIND